MSQISHILDEGLRVFNLNPHFAKNVFNVYFRWSAFHFETVSRGRQVGGSRDGTAVEIATNLGRRLALTVS